VGSKKPVKVKNALLGIEILRSVNPILTEPFVVKVIRKGVCLYGKESGSENALVEVRSGSWKTIKHANDPYSRNDLTELKTLLQQNPKNEPSRILANRFAELRPARRPRGHETLLIGVMKD
jgi:hypothetical protein